MPWRKNTLTTFRPGDSDQGADWTVSSCSEPGVEPSEVQVKEDVEQALDSLTNSLMALRDEPFEDFQNLFGDQDSSIGPDWERCSSGQGRDSTHEAELGLSQVPRGRLLDAEGMDQMFSAAFINTRKRQHVVMPWETEFAKKIFKREPVVPAPLTNLSSTWVHWEPPGTTPNLLEPDDQAVFSQVEEGPLYAKALMAISDQTFQEQCAEQTSSAVEKWLSILRLHPTASEVGRLLLEDDPPGSAKLGARRTIEAVLGVRSRATSISRANAFLRFVNWRELEHGKQDFAEVLEDDVWHYFCWLQDTMSAPTRAQGLLSAMNYMRHVFGYEVLQPVCESRRLAGLADVLYAAKAPLRQAKVLTVDEVAWLHLRLEDMATHKTDRAIVAYILTALYGRCRHSDLAHVTRVLQDFDNAGGFMEIQTRTHKTAKSAANKAVLLPIVVPAIGITGQLWIQHAIDAFNEVGLQLIGELDGPLFRPPLRDGSEGNCKRGITSAEITRFLRLCFEKDGDVGTLGRVSSHSLKATALSWTAKACLDAADQAILGRHSSAFTETSAVYSRDTSIRAVSKLQEVIKAIAKKEFLPDCERSCYFPRSGEGADSVQTQHVDSAKVEEAGLDLSGNLEGRDFPPVVDLLDPGWDLSSESSSSEEADSGSELAGPSFPRSMRHTLSRETAAFFVRHRVSKLVHFRDGEQGVPCGTLSCGRTLNANYEQVFKFGTFDLCKRCRLNAEKDGILKCS